jgi:aspartate aminotransferase
MNRLLKDLKQSSTLELNQLAKDMAQQGKSVVNLTAGEPDFNTPERILIAAQKAMKEGKTKYTHTSGIAELRNVIRNKITQQYGKNYSADEVLVCNGGKQAIFNFCYALLNPGDEVIIPTPSWVSYQSMVEMVGAMPVTVHSPMTEGFEPNIEAIEQKISPRTKLIMLNSPNNPSGAVFSKSFFESFEKLLERHPQIWVMTDDIYEKFLYDGVPFYSIGMSPKVSKERLMIVSGASKTYSMTGWRVGFAVGPKEIITVMANIQSQTTSNVCSISQWAALEAFQGGSDAEYAQFLELFQNRRNLAYETISLIPGIQCMKPQGAFYIMPNVQEFLGKKSPSGKVIHTDDDLAYDLLERKGVATVPGSSFGAPGYIRFSFVVPSEIWNEGVKRFREGLMELKD